METVVTQWVLVTSLIVVFGIVTMVLVAGTQGILRLRWRVLRRGVTTLLYRAYLRLADHEEDNRELMLRSKRDATTLLDPSPAERVSRSDGSKFQRLFAARTTWITTRELQVAIIERCPHLKAQSVVIANGLKHLAPAMSREFRTAIRLCTAFWAIVLVVAYGIVDALNTDGSGTTGESLHLNLVRVFSGPPGSTAAADIAAVLIVATLVGFSAHLAYHYLGGATSVSDSATSHNDEQAVEIEDEPTQPDFIGRPNCAVRAISFAGGGFDTFMQLGVTHSLMVIQGRAPDVVVGLSAGSAQAAALAEILQAGEEHEPADWAADWGRMSEDEKCDLQKARQSARVNRFREFLDVCFHARENIVDSIMPDAYQIDRTDPLAPLQTPFFRSSERAQRLESLGAKSGLIRLYNDLLGLDIQFGTIVRIARRILGLRAASDIPGVLKRQLVKAAEAMRMWLLVGVELPHAANLLPLALSPLLGFEKGVHPSTAGSLIFRFEPLSTTWRHIKSAFWLFVLVTFWLGATLWPVWLGAIIAEQFEIAAAWIFGAAIYSSGILLTMVATHFMEFSNKRDVFLDTFRGFFQLTWLTTKWALVLFGFLLSVFVPLSLFDEPLVGVIDQSLDWAKKFTAAGAATFVLVVLLIALSSLLMRVATPFKSNRPQHSVGSWGWYVRRFLESYNIAGSLFHPHALRVFLAAYFDRNYYGEVDLDTVVDESLKNRFKSPACANIERKTISYYSSPERAERIHVGLAVADTANGDLKVIPDRVPVVNGLVAAMAAVPLFPAQVVEGRLYVDGSNVANVPTRALLSMVRKRVNKHSRMVHIYSVAPLPFSRPHLRVRGESTTPYLHLMDIAREAMMLQRFRDARLERILLEIFTQVIPAQDVDGSNLDQMTFAGEDGEENYVRAWVTPIELEEPTSLNQRIMLASVEERRAKILETVADGCRASLETMIGPSIRARILGRDGAVASCREAVLHHLDSRKINGGYGEKVAQMMLPGSSRDCGPGLREICTHCALNRGATDECQQRLKPRNWEKEGPPWPHEREQEDRDLDNDPHFVAKDPFKKPDMKEVWGRKLRDWPREETGKNITERPTVSFLFSGGVFRGVFQMGVLNALNELRLTPDLVAGASIGSITAAMAARSFSMEKDRDPLLKTPYEAPYRQRQIMRLAAVYLAVDRMILTDRFADFVRALTIRASSTKFSLRKLDFLFRRYDHPGLLRFDRSAREVLAGIEQLLYINPFQLKELVKALRDDENEEAFEKLRRYLQQWLRRMGVEVEILGAEPLQLLIQNYVLPERYRGKPGEAPFNAFTDNAIRLIATTTNMTLGGLKILGMHTDDEKDDSIGLMESLLASSAFPAVFRPRWSWELFPASVEEEQLIDGGVTDNLPLDAVLNFLVAASNATPSRIHDRPIYKKSGRPHLILAASLQPETQKYSHPDEWQHLIGDWLALRKRTKELGYNAKVDVYRSAEHKVRKIYNELLRRANGNPDLIDAELRPIDVEILAVKPKWLCGTFAFHSMLGFRRAMQAKSIAHGCASTLLEFARTSREYRDGWRVDESVPSFKTFHEAETAWKKTTRAERRNMCWLRPDVICPFSRKGLLDLSEQMRQMGEAPIDPQTIQEVAKIHAYCIRPATHRSR